MPFHSWYHWSVNPCHLKLTCGSRACDWLKLYRIITRIGVTR